jgi:hypothetical protein
MNNRLALRIVRRGIRAIEVWQLLGHASAVSGPRMGQLLASRRLNRSGQQRGAVRIMVL